MFTSFRMIRVPVTCNTSAADDHLHAERIVREHLHVARRDRKHRRRE